jgi:hypothetical protein
LQFYILHAIIKGDSARIPAYKAIDGKHTDTTSGDSLFTDCYL